MTTDSDGTKDTTTYAYTYDEHNNVIKLIVNYDDGDSYTTTVEYKFIYIHPNLSEEQLEKLKQTYHDLCNILKPTPSRVKFTARFLCFEWEIRKSPLRQDYVRRFYMWHRLGILSLLYSHIFP